MKVSVSPKWLGHPVDTDVLNKHINLSHAGWAQMVVKVTETDHRGTQREILNAFSGLCNVFFCMYIVLHLQY